MHPVFSDSGEAGDIVIVDDNPADLRLLSTVLREGGHHVCAAINARVALSAIRSQNPDLVTLDISMPDIDGIEPRSGHPVHDEPRGLRTAAGRP